MPESQPYPGFISKQVLNGRYLFGDFDSEPNDQGLTVHCAGREECAPDFHLVRAGFRYHAFEYIASGRWSLRVNGQDCILEPGAVFGYTPETSFELRALDSEGLIKYFIDFSGKRAIRRLLQCRIADGTPAYLGSGHRLHEIFDQIIDAVTSPPAVAAEMAGYLADFMLLRIREDARGNFHPASHAHETYLRSRRYIENHFSTLRTVETAAEACHVDPSYLCRLFREHGGETPYQFLIRLKMNRAAEFLVLKHSTIKEAAHAVNFDDPYHFSRVFKKTFGLAPRHFVQRFLERRRTGSTPIGRTSVD